MKSIVDIATKVINRTDLHILKTLCFDGKTVRCTDLETSIVWPFKSDLHGTVSLEIFKGALRGKPKSLKVAKNHLDIDGGMLTFHKGNGEDFPCVPKESFTFLGEWNFWPALAKQLPFCSTDVLKPSITGVEILQENGKVHLCATDGHTLRAVKYLPGGEVDFLGIVPAKPLKILAKYGNAKVSASANFLRAEFKEMTIYIRLIPENYPMWKSVIPNPSALTGKAMFDKETMLAVIKRATPFVDWQSRGTINTEDMSLTVKNTVSETAWKDTIPLSDQEGKHICVDYNLRYLEKVIRGAGSDVVLWEYQTPLLAATFNGSPDVFTLLMPIKPCE